MAQKLTVPQFAAASSGGKDELAISQAQEGVIRLTEQVNQQPYVAGDGAMVTELLLAGTTTKVRHRLGRLPTGWLVLRMRGGLAQLFEVNTPTSKADTIFIPLTNSGSDSTVTLWFF